MASSLAHSQILTQTHTPTQEILTQSHTPTKEILTQTHTPTKESGEFSSPVGDIIVIKVGTSSLIDSDDSSDNEGPRFALANLAKLVETVCRLRNGPFDMRPVIISSGAVGVGCLELGLKSPPQTMVEKQAVSAMGQSQLMRLYTDFFGVRKCKVAQLLLTRHDLSAQPRFINLKNTLLQLLRLNVVPIINENDALVTEGLNFGDNDTLGAHVSVAIGARFFAMLTDVDCLYDQNPRANPLARPIARIDRLADLYTSLDVSRSKPLTHTHTHQNDIHTFV